MKGKIAKLANLGIVKTAVVAGSFGGKNIELGVTNTNTTWGSVFGSRVPKLGEEVEIDDSAIQEGQDPATGAKTGRHFISRVSADKEREAIKIMQNQALAKSGKF